MNVILLTLSNALQYHLAGIPDNKMNTTFQAVVAQVGMMTSQATVRQHSVLIDRAIEKGGTDRGPAGGEYMLVALGGCFLSHLLAAGHARKAAVTDVRVAVTGTMDGTPQRFTAFALDVTATGADLPLLPKLILIAARGCQVVGTLRQITTITITHDGRTVNPAAEPTDGQAAPHGAGQLPEP